MINSLVPHRCGNILGGSLWAVSNDWGEIMRISIPGLGGRLRRARNSTGLSQEAVATELGISWMTVHRWERSQRAVPDHLLDKVCEVYDKPLPLVFNPRRSLFLPT